MLDRIKKSLVGQFMHPRGLGGGLAGWVMARKNRDRIAWVVERLAVEPGNHVLEVGFGPGVAIQYLASQVPGVTVEGIEASEVMLQQARRRNRAAIRDGSVKLRAVAVEDFRGPEREADVIFTVNSLPFFEDPAGTVQHARDWLKPAGRPVLVHQVPLKRAEPERIRQLRDEFLGWIEAAGLRPGRVETGPGEPNPVILVEGIR